MNRHWTIAKNDHGVFAIPVESNYTFTSRTILQGRVHEAPTIDYIVKNCGSGDVIHAGAGFGDFLPKLSANCLGNIYTFEPNEINYAACQETIRLNNLHNIILNSCGIGDMIQAKANLKVYSEGLALGVRSEIVKEKGSETQEITVDTLDNLLLFSSKRVSIIHLDIEGYEFLALDGARGLISRDRPTIILEIDGRALDYNHYMKGLGYKPTTQLIYDAGEMVFVNTVYQLEEVLY